MKIYKLVLILIVLVLLIGMLIPLFTIPSDQYWLVIKPFFIFLIPAILLGALLALYPIMNLKQMIPVFSAMFVGLFVLMIFTRIHLIGTLLFGVGGICMVFVKSRMKQKNAESLQNSF